MGGGGGLQGLGKEGEPLLGGGIFHWGGGGVLYHKGVGGRGFVVWVMAVHKSLVSDV